MKINRHNYEEYLLDFIEGNLLTNEAEVVKSFLNKNPDIKSEAEDLLNCKLTSEVTEFNNKNFLKKDPELDIEGISKFERLSVAFLENDINNEENLMLDEMLKQSETKQYEHQLVQKSKLIASENIVFPDKSKLKQFRLASTRRIIYFTSSLAASIALLISIFLINPGNETGTGLALNYNDLATPKIRQSTVNNDVIDIEQFVAKITFLENNTVDTTYNMRVSENIMNVESKKASLFESNSGEKPLSSETLFALANKTIIQSKQKTDVKVEDYVSNTLQELGIEKQSSEKPLLAKAGNSIAQFFGKLFKKNIQVKKVDFEDGRKLYAVRAGSLEFYTNVKSRKSKDKNPEENQINNGE